MADLPALHTLAISHNPDLRGHIPPFFPFLLDLDISNTSDDLCSSRALFSSGSLRRLTARDVDVAFRRCSSLVFGPTRSLEAS